MNTIYKFILLVLLFQFANSQQDTQYALYKYNMNIINPAYAGSNEKTEFLLSFRSQWVGIQDGPETQSFNFNAPIGKKVGLGFSIVNDRIFVLNETDVYADFSYALTLNQHTKLFMGLKAGGTFLNIDLAGLVEDDPLFAENVSQFNPNFGLGFLLKSNNYYITLSSPALLKADRYEKEGAIPISSTDKFHFYAGAGYLFQLSNNWSIEPSILMKSVSGAPLSIDFSAEIVYNNRIGFGANYRTDESITGLFTFRGSDWLQLGYAYEYAANNLSTVSDGTHEVFIKFLFKKKVSTQ